MRVPGVHASTTGAVIRGTSDCQTVVDPELHITVAAPAPLERLDRRRTTSDLTLRPPYDIQHEMQLVKAALLYADRVALASYRVSWVLTWRQLDEARQRGDLAEVVRLLAALAGTRWTFTSSEQPEGDRPPGRAQDLEGFESRVTSVVDRFRGRVESALGQASWQELRRAVESGALEIRPIGLLTEYGFNSGAVVGELIGLLADVLGPSSKTVPMLDERVSAILRAAGTTGLVGTMPIAASEVGLAAHYIAQVPAFPEASIDVVLDARRELHGPLVRYRAAMAEFATALAAAPPDANFPLVADELYRREVAPKLQELQELAEERKLTSALQREVATGGSKVVKASISFAAAAAASLPFVAQAAVAAAAVAAEVGGNIYARFREIDAVRRQNKLLWLYEAERVLRHHKSAVGRRRTGT